MAISQFRSDKKASGGKYKSSRKKKQYELGDIPSLTKLGAKKTRTKTEIGNRKKTTLLDVDFANITDPKTGKTKKAKIKTILESPANRHYTRRNIMTRGSIIETDMGKARITSRPGQEGAVNAVLIK